MRRDLSEELVLKCRLPGPRDPCGGLSQQWILLLVLLGGALWEDRFRNALQSLLLPPVPAPFLEQHFPLPPTSPQALPAFILLPVSAGLGSVGKAFPETTDPLE